MDGGLCVGSRYPIKHAEVLGSSERGGSDCVIRYDLATPGGVFAINSEHQTADRLAGRLKEIYDPRPEKVIFVKGAPNVKYADVIFAMDVARGAGVKVIGIPPKDVPGAAPAAK